MLLFFVGVDARVTRAAEAQTRRWRWWRAAAFQRSDTEQQKLAGGVSAEKRNQLAATATREARWQQWK